VLQCWGKWLVLTGISGAMMRTVLSPMSPDHPVCSWASPGSQWRRQCLELLSGDRRVDRNIKNRNGDTRVMFCLENNKIEMTRCLINTTRVGWILTLLIQTAENDPSWLSPHQTGRQCLQSVQGRRAADPLHQKQPEETGPNSGGQAGGRNHNKSKRFSTGFLLTEIIDFHCWF